MFKHLLIGLIQGIRSLTTSKRVFVLGALVVVASAAFIYEWASVHQQQTTATKLAAAHQQLAAKSTPVTPPKPAPAVTPTPQQTAISGPATTTPAATPSKSIALAPKPAPAPQPQTVDFTLNPATVTITLGESSSNLQAISANGQAIWWGVLGGNGIVVTNGMTSNSAEVVHNFTVTPSTQLTKPGTYQMNIMGYIPHGPSVTKQLTIIVVPAAAPPNQ